MWYSSRLTPASTIQINQSEVYQAINTIAISNLTVDGNGSSGGSAEIKARNNVTLQSGFWAKSGSHVHVHTGPFLVPCTTWPDVLFESKNVLQSSSIAVEREIEVQFNVEATEGIVRVYPNPSEGIFMLVLPGTGRNDNIQVSVFDFLGRLILDRSYISRALIELDIKEYPSGSYYLIVHANGNYISRKIFKF